MRELVIDRKKWLRGEVFGLGAPSVLRSRENGFKGAMCCLGFYLKDLGVPTRTLLDNDSPADVQAAVPKEGAWLLKKAAMGDQANSAECNSLMGRNDETGVDEDAREISIAKMFKRNGVRVSFIN